MRLNQFPGATAEKPVYQAKATPLTPAIPKVITPAVQPTISIAPAPASAKAATSATTSAENAAVNQSVDTINNYIQKHKQAIGNIEFSVDPESGRTLTKVVDKDTNTVLLQIPSKEALAISESLGNQKGFLINAIA